MAGKDRKSAITKHLNKDSQLEKSTEAITLRRGRKSTSSVFNDSKSSMELKSPSTGKSKKKEKPQDGRITPNTRKRRYGLDAEGEQDAARTPPPPTKSKKAFLEKELEDILENATGRNTPSTPRTRKLNDKEEDNGESEKLARTRRGGSDGSDAAEDKSGLSISKIKKSNEKEVDDDNVSVRSFTTLLRTRKTVDKDIDDDMLSVRSMNMKTKKSEINDDAASVQSLSRTNLIKNVGRKKKSGAVVKKKIFLKRGRPKKNQNDQKGKISSKKKVPKKVPDELVEVKESKRILNKSLKFQSKIGGQRRLRSAMLLKKQKLKKTKLAADDKQCNRQNQRGMLTPGKEGFSEINVADIDHGKTDKERLRLDSQNVKSDLTKLESSEIIGFLSEDGKKDGKGVGCKRRLVRKDIGKKSDGKPLSGEKGGDVYSFNERDSSPAPRGVSEKMNPKMKQTKLKMGKKLSNESKKKKKKKVPGIHFETTSCPDDSSLIIVQPRLGPKIKYARLKQLYIKSNALNKTPKKSKASEVVPKEVLPVSNSATITNLHQLGSPYFAQSIPNYKLLAANSAIRTYNSVVSTNVDSSKPVGPSNLSLIEESGRTMAAFGPKVANDVIITPSGIVLSSCRLVPPGAPQTPTASVNGPNSAFVTDPSSSSSQNTSQTTLGNAPTAELLQHKISNNSQSPTCTKTNTAIFSDKPEAVPTSVVGTATDVLSSSSSTTRLNNSCDVGVTKGFASVAATQTDLASPEKAPVMSSTPGNGQNLYKNLPNLSSLPKILVARNVNELLMMKGEVENCSEKNNVNADKTEPVDGGKVSSRGELSMSADEGEPPSVSTDNKYIMKRTKRMLRNVRQNHSSVSELTYSEPENSCSETYEQSLFKTISCERLNKSLEVDEGPPKVLLQLGSEPVALSDALAPFETASAFLLNKNDNIDKKLKMDYMEMKDSSPNSKEAIEVCNFSKENEEALRELGLDSDLDQTKSENDTDSTPVKVDDDMDASDPTTEYTKKERIKEEVDNVLKEMPNRKIPNLLRKTECFNLSKNKLEIKNPLVLKNNDYLTKSPSKPPTVIDKLLERNKSLKKAEQESKYQKSAKNLSENLDNYEKSELKHKKSLREVRSRKFLAKNDQRRLVANKRYISTNSGCKVYERRGSNPELFSNNYLAAETKVSNENVPLRRALDICENRDKFQRRGSIDFDSIQRVMERRNSLPVGGEDGSTKFSNSVDDATKSKTENIKTILVGTETKTTSKSQGNESSPRVINIITEDDGTKKGQNLMEEIGMEISKDTGGKIYMNGEDGRRASVDSYTSDSEKLKKLIDNITGAKRDQKSATEVPYTDDNSTLRVEKRLSSDKKSSDEKSDSKTAVIEETPEDLVEKETILSALGLQRAAAQNAQQKKDSGNINQSESVNYTGTLKTVIKIHRPEKKGNSKAPMKMIYKASSSSSSLGATNDDPNNLDHDVDVTSKEDTEEEVKNGNGKAKSLVIPEKASSFSIHPGRMCSDVCTYCFGKFGLLDTPCHIAQLKDAHKRRNILETETHLLPDSCLCDACFRHVDKKSNCPTFTERKGEKRKYTMRKQFCCARNCNADSQHNVRRKWFVKLKKSIGRKIVLDQAKLEKIQPGHLVPLCHRHFYWVDYFMSCGICKKRLTSVNMCRIGLDVMDVNSALSADGIPTILTDKRFLCKICHCYISIRVKFKHPSEMSNNQCQFYETYRKRILQCYEIEVPDSEGEQDRDGRSDHKNVRRTRKSARPTATVTNGGLKSDNETEVSLEELDKTNECDKDSEMKEISHMNIPPKANGNLDFGGVSITPSTTEVNPTQIHVKLGNLNIGALGNLNIGQDVRHGSRSSDIQCFPTEAELALRAHFDLQPSAEDESAKTTRKGFEKCTTTIQFSPETKNLFYSLQMPYGNHSSFFRHLILLEKYFRSGDLVISRNADPKAINYISSVQNRIRSYEGIHSPVKKPMDISPSLSILPQPIKTESKSMQDIQQSVIQSRPFTLTPMPSNTVAQVIPKNSPLSHMQATVQNIPTPSNQSQNQGYISSLLKSLYSKGTTSHLKPEISITSVPSDPPLPPPPPPPSVRIGKTSTQSAASLTTKIQENLRNLASKSQNSKQSNQARAVILNRTVGGQKQSLVQVTTGGKTIHLTLYQFRRIQQMQMRKKQYLEHQAKALKTKEEANKNKSKSSDEVFDIKNLSSELEIQEIKQPANGSETFPLISEVRSLAGDDIGWDKNSGDGNDGQANDSFPKIPKALSISVTKIPSADYSKEQSVDSVE